MSFRWGELAAAALLVSLVSGFVVGYQYEVGDPLVSTVAIATLLPFGAFWRALHFYASQGFVVLLLVHTWDVLRQNALGRQEPMRWVILTMTIPAGVLALFSGYVLRADATGQAAGTIAEHLIMAVPWVGQGLDRFLIAIAHEGLNRVYLLHVLLTALLWGVGTWYHTRRVVLGWTALAQVLICSILVAILIKAPMDAPGAEVDLIKGPWFFLGVQELLRYLSPVFGGILYPLAPVAILSCLPWILKRALLWALLSVWLISYIGASLVMWLR